MTNATFDDLSEDGSKVIRQDQAYRVTVKSLGNKTEITFDTTLKQKFPTLQDAIGIALKNGLHWEKVTWEKDPESGKLKKKVEEVLDDTHLHEKTKSE